MKRQQGFMFVLLAVIIVILSVVGAAVVNLFTNNLERITNELAAKQAFYLAESGLERSKRALLLTNPANFNNRIACNAMTGNPLLTDVAFDNGRYNISAIFYPTSGRTFLSAPINSVTTTIPVVSTVGYAPSGRIQIEHEVIDYQTVTANSFLNATRGVGGSSAANHVANAAVGQQQCSVDVQSGTPDLTAAAMGRRQLTMDLIQTSHVWVAGAAGVTNNISSWDGASFNLNNFSGAPSVAQLNSIFMLSPADGWAVGNIAGASNSFYRWDGANWNFFATVLPNINFTAVTCNHTNDCWAVGTGGATVHWDGVNWTSIVSGVPESLNSVHCVNSNDCWASGTNGTTLHWNGTSWVNIVSGLGQNLNGVFCPAANDCWAVGAGGTTLHWNGSAWSSVASSSSQNLNSIYCNGSNDCWAVGQNQTVIHWNGANWSPVSTGLPNVPLMGVHCSSSQDCWLVGNAIGSALILHWDGASWTRIGPFAGIPAQPLNSVYSISVTQQPKLFYKEIFT